MDIRIGAIFRDEYDYVIEWLAWHRLAGFTKFTIADNGSDDGTLQLLEALEELGLLELHYQPRTVSNAQLVAYRKICERHIGSGDAVLFIDADEFVVHESFVNGREYEALYGLLFRQDVGMVGINWRCFGSSGHESKDLSPVVSRFTKCASDEKINKNCHLKSATKISYAYQIGPHISYLYPPYKRMDVQGVEISKFIEFKDGQPRPVSGMPEGIAENIVAGPLRIHHYVIKSKEEFIKKKLNRGDAMGGEAAKKDLSYFNSHDFNQAEFIFPASKLDALAKEMSCIKYALEKTTLRRKLIGAVDKSTERFISGWVCDQVAIGSVKVSIFVNGRLQGRTTAAYYRPDLEDQKISLDGMCGFYFHHEVPLHEGDQVEVKVVGNNCRLMGNRVATIVGVV
jgi:glycosyltransferase involved in cell wall biosynthesis